MSLSFRNIALRCEGMTLELNAILAARVTGLFGPSGAGKTSLLELAAGLRKPERGVVELDGIPLVDSARGIFVPARKRGIGYVPQDLALFPHLTVERNITYGVSAGNSGLQDKLVELLGIESLLPRMPATLSGGEKQRTAIARALLSSPRMLLLDEPLASLDHPLRERILPYLERVRDEFQIPILYATHSAPEVVALCGEVLVLKAGRCVAQGTPQEIFTQSQATVYRLKDE